VTPEELRYNALVVMQANLQRLVVLRNSAAHVAGRPADAAALGDLHRQLDVIGQVIERADEARAVTPADVALVRPFAAPLLAAVEAYYATDLTGPPATRAAFGAAHVYASMHLNRGTIRMGEVFGHEDWADRARQHVPTFQTLRLQAQTAVGSSASGAPSEEAVRFITHHVEVALGDRATVLAQVAGIEPMLDGRDPRRA
jgi:hypothetical protein